MGTVPARSDYALLCCCADGPREAQVAVHYVEPDARRAAVAVVGREEPRLCERYVHVVVAEDEAGVVRGVGGHWLCCEV